MRINEKSYWNTYHYFINEDFKANNFQNNYSGKNEANQKRYFTVNNLDVILPDNSKLVYSCLIDYAYKNYNFGSLSSNVESFQFFNSISNKRYFTQNLSIQYGGDYSVTNYNFDENKPVYYYNLEPNALYYNTKKEQNLQTLSGFIYSNWEISDKIGISSAIRSNLPMNSSDRYLSYQFSTHYEPSKPHRFIFSAGKYHSYSTPNYINHATNLLSSNQIALDYYFDLRKFNFSTAVYHKIDNGDSYFSTTQNTSFNKVRSTGWEISTTFNFNKNLSLSVSNIILKQKIYLGDASFTGTNNLNYFVKGQLTYSNFNLFTASLSYTARQGGYYTPVVNAIYNNSANNYEPIFASNFNSAQFGNYNKVDFTINKIIPLKKHGIISFLSLNNILNTNNQASAYYNKYYTNTYYNSFQKRILYIGCQFRFTNL